MQPSTRLTIDVLRERAEAAARDRQRNKQSAGLFDVRPIRNNHVSDINAIFLS